MPLLLDFPKTLLALVRVEFASRETKKSTVARLAEILA